MRASRLLPLLLICTLPTIVLSQNLLPNGNFEDTFTGWTEVGTVQLSTNAYSGTAALMASDTARAAFSYAYQAFDLTYAVHEVNFWFFPASAEYFSAFELIANWQGGTADFITRILFRDSTVAFTALDVSATVPNPLTPNAWNKVTVRVDSTSLQQDFYLNDQLMSSLTSGAFPPIEHLLVGDLSLSGMYGTVYFDEITITEGHSATANEPGEVPAGLVLHQNHPNPFRNHTAITYHLPQTAPVEVYVVNVLGQRVATLVDGVQAAGPHRVTWDGKSAAGQDLAAGPYLYLLKTKDFTLSKKLILLR